MSNAFPASVEFSSFILCCVLNLLIHQTLGVVIPVESGMLKPVTAEPRVRYSMYLRAPILGSAVFMVVMTTWGRLTWLCIQT